MTIENNVRKAIHDCREKLTVIEAAVRSEISKPIRQRRYNLLTFLYKEKEIYSFALNSLEKILGDDLCAKEFSE